MLNPDQQKAKQAISNWWPSNKRFFILEGRAGTGKTFLLLDVLKSLKNCVPILTAPTNEAVRQMELVIGGEYPLRTTYSIMGFSFDTSKEVKKLKQMKNPTELDDYNLMVIDEASMIGEELLEAILNSGIKVLFVGHRHQLPEVKANLSVFDKCESVVFTKNYPYYQLTTPVRNVGEIYTFCNHIESLIYADRRILKSGYGKSLSYLFDFIKNNSSDKIMEEQTKIIAWSNKEVDRMNTLVREHIYGKKELKIFMPGDKLILTAPTDFIGNIDKKPETQLVKLKSKKIRLTTNSKLEVVKIRFCDVLGVVCYGLSVLYQGVSMELFVPKYPEQLKQLYNKYKFEAYGKTSVKAKQRAFQKLHYIMSLFARVKHSYALTAYRSQGMTIPEVIVRQDDINKCQNVYLKYKLLYVAASRAENDLVLIK